VRALTPISFGLLSGTEAAGPVSRMSGPESCAGGLGLFKHAGSSVRSTNREVRRGARPDQGGSDPESLRPRVRPSMVTTLASPPPHARHMSTSANSVSIHPYDDPCHRGGKGTCTSRSHRKDLSRPSRSS